MAGFRHLHRYLRRRVRGAVVALVAVAAAAAVAGCGASASGPASPAGTTNAASTAVGLGGAAFYAGKTITYIVPFGPGGGFDRWGRLVASYLGKQLHATVDVQNKPGGGGLVGEDMLFASKPDGLTIGGFDGPGAVFETILHTPGMNFDLSHITWVARDNADPHVLLVSTSSPWKTAQELVQTHQQIAALSTGVGAADYDISLVSLQAFHLPYKMIFGFSTAAAQRTALIRGDGNWSPSTYSSGYSLVASHKARILMQFSDTRWSKLANVPTAEEVAKQNHVSSTGMRALAALDSIEALGKDIAAPPGIPASRLAALESALQAVFHDPAFLAQASKEHLYPGYLDGSQAGKLAQAGLREQSIILQFLKSSKKAS